MTPDEVMQEIEQWMQADVYDGDYTNDLGAIGNDGLWYFTCEGARRRYVTDSLARHCIVGWLQEWCKDIPRTEKNADLFYAVDFYSAAPGFLSALWELHKVVEGIKVG